MAVVFAVCWSDVGAGGGIDGSSSIAVSSIGAGLDLQSAVLDEKRSDCTNLVTGGGLIAPAAAPEGA